jgi:hypothetical protein
VSTVVEMVVQEPLLHMTVSLEQLTLVEVAVELELVVVP